MYRLEIQRSASRYRAQTAHWEPAARETVSQQDLSRSSSEISPFVAWHSGRQDSTGHETSFRAIAPARRSVCVGGYTGRFGGVAFDGSATSKPAPFANGAKSAAPVNSKPEPEAKSKQINHKMRCPSGMIPLVVRSIVGGTNAKGLATRQKLCSWRVAFGV